MDERSGFREIETSLVSLASPGIRPGLARLARLLGILGNPQRRFPSLLVVGTNGKGSTSAALTSCLVEGGYRTALYTSPHLESLGERLLVDRFPLAASRWREGLALLEAALRQDRRLQEDRPSYFELLTALCFHLIAEEKVDVAVVEAGMGGRLDATHILGDVRAVLCTPLGLDHQEYLGDTLPRIASEKFAVLRPGRPAVFAGADPEVEALFLSRARRIGASPWIHRTSCRVELAHLDLEGVRFHRFSLGASPQRDLVFPLTGVHQPGNASLALGALEHLGGLFPRLDPATLRRGLAATRWPGRMEWFPKGEGGVLLDGAHNPHGVEALARSLEALGVSGEGWGLVFAAMGDKEILPSLRRLAPFFETLWCTSVPESPRALPAASLADRAREAGWPGLLEIQEDPLDALDRALRRHPRVVACGSLFLVGHLRGHRSRWLSGTP